MIGRLTSIFLIATVFASVLSAQDSTSAAPTASSGSSSANSSMGFKLMYGAGMPSYEGLPAGTETETDVAWSVGAFWNWSTGGVISFAVQPELHYVAEQGIISGSSPVTTSTNSLRLPILAKIEFLDRNLVQPSVYVGPSFSYMLSAKQEAGGVTSDIPNTNAFQFGLAAGVDVTFLRIFVVDIRYNTKFSEISSDVSETVDGVTLSMNSFRVGLGLRF